MSARIERSPKHASNRNSRFSQRVRAEAAIQPANAPMDREIGVLRGSLALRTRRMERSVRVQIEVLEDRRRKQSP